MLRKFGKNVLAKFGYRVSRISGLPPDNSMEFGISTLRRLGFTPCTVLDVGASDGRWSEIAIGFFPDAHYVLFEHQVCHSDGLSRFQERHRERVTIVTKAVGRKSGFSYFDASDPFGGALRNAAGDRVIEVGVTSLDETVADLKSQSPYLIKLDTHGYERSILDGSGATLQKACALVIEAYNYKLTDECMLFWELCSYLQQLNFRPVAIADTMRRRYDQTLWQMDLFFVSASWPGFSHVTYD
jgi:FkbM family methyltransferase